MSKTKKKKGRTYVAKNRRILDDHGNFSKYQEDHEASALAYIESGTTAEEVEAERELKRVNRRNLNSVTGQQAAISSLSDEALEAELAKRKKGTKAPKEPKTDEEKGYSTDMPKPKAIAGLKEDHESESNSGESAGGGEDLSELTNAELKAKLDEMGAVYAPRANKAKLLALIANDGMPDNGTDLDGEGL